MKVIYDKHKYEFKGDLDCIFFSSLIEEGIDEIELFLYEIVFLRLLNKNNEIENVFYFLGDSLDFKNIEETYKALSYFGSKYLNEFVYEVYIFIKSKELYTFQKIHDEFFTQYFHKLGFIKTNHAFSLEFRKRKHTFDSDDLEQNTFKNYFNENVFIRYDEVNKVPFEIIQKRYSEFVHNIWLWDNKYLPPSFIEKHINDADIETIAQYGRKSFIEKNIHLFKGLMIEILLGYNKNLDIDFLKEHNITPRENYNRRFWTENFTKTEKGKSICITYEYVKNNPDKIDWWWLSQNDFDLEYRLYNKINETIYFDFAQLERDFKKFNVY